MTAGDDIGDDYPRDERGSAVDGLMWTTHRQPAEAVTIIPKKWEFVYAGYQDGVDALKVAITDRRLGPIQLMLDKRAAEDLVYGVRYLLDRLDLLREADAEHFAPQRNQDNEGEK